MRGLSSRSVALIALGLFVASVAITSLSAQAQSPTDTPTPSEMPTDTPTPELTSTATLAATPDATTAAPYLPVTLPSGLIGQLVYSVTAGEAAIFAGEMLIIVILLFGLFIALRNKP